MYDIFCMYYTIYGLKLSFKNVLLTYLYIHVRYRYTAGCHIWYSEEVIQPSRAVKQRNTSTWRRSSRYHLILRHLHGPCTTSSPGASIDASPPAFCRPAMIETRALLS